MHKSSEFRGIVFMMWVKGECPIHMLHTKLFGFFFKRPHKHQKAASLSAINTFSSQSPGPQDQEILNWFQLYVV